MNSVADTKTYAEILRDIPAFSTLCPGRPGPLRHRERLHHARRSRSGNQLPDGFEPQSLRAGGRFGFPRRRRRCRVALEPGDYFGGDSGHRHLKLAASVVAEEDAEVLVIRPEQIIQLQQAGSRRRHPSNADWSPEVAVPSLRLLPSRRRPAVLARSAS